MELPTSEALLQVARHASELRGRTQIQSIEVTHMPASLSPEAFVSALVGQPVSHVWRGHGSALFLELGRLDHSRSRHPRGAHGISIEWSWRIQDQTSVVLGTFSSDEKLDAAPGLLQGAVIREISFFGVLPEVEVLLDSGLRLLSFATQEGDPEWAIRVHDTSLHVRGGQLVFEHSPPT